MTALSFKFDGFFAAELILVVVFLIACVIYQKRQGHQSIGLLSNKKDEDDDDDDGSEIPVDTGDYFALGESLFLSADNQELKIRVISGNGGRYKDKDLFTLAFSLPHHFNERNKKEFLLYNPQLIDATVLDTHCLLIKKSPAVDFLEIQKEILRFLFSLMYENYRWMVEAQEVSIVKDKDSYIFKLSSSLYFHGQLLAALAKLPVSITADSAAENDCFIVSNYSPVSWEDLLARIKVVFEEYFKAGISFNQ